MSPLDWLLSLGLIVFLFVFCVQRSKTHLFWPDELLGYRVLGAPTWRAMLRGWYEGADGGGPLYYVTGRLWTDLFGLSPLTMRLFSTAGVSVALLLVWSTARRFASTVAVAVAVALVYFTPAEWLWQASNGRFYGLFLAAAAWAGMLFLDAAEAEPTPAQQVFTGLAHAFLIGSHILGLIYSFTLILGLVFLRSARHRSSGPASWRWVAAALTGWAILPVSAHAIYSSTAIATTRFWTQRPNFDDLVKSLTFSSVLAKQVLTTLLLLLLLRASVPAWRRVRNPQPSARPTLVLLCCLLLADLILFAKSQIRISIFADRYLLPLSIGMVLLFAILLMRVLPRTLIQPSNPLVSAAFSLAMLVYICVPVPERTFNEIIYPPASFPKDIAAALPAGVPILVTPFPAYNELAHYAPGHNFLYLLDWDYDERPEHASGDYSTEHLMQNARNAGYEPGHILSCHEIFSRYPDLLLLTEERRLPWLHDRLLQNPDYQVTQLTAIVEWEPMQVWSVHARLSGHAPC